MHKITSLNALTLAEAKQGQPSLQFVIKTRVYVAISTGRKNRVRQNHITTKTEGLTHQTAASCLKFEPHQVQSLITHKSKYRYKVQVTPGYLHKPRQPRVLGKPHPLRPSQEASTRPTVRRQP